MEPDLPDEIRATGGGTRSALWRRILADVLGTAVVTTSTEQGAATLAAVGAGWFASVQDACRGLVQVQDRIEPSSDANRYRALHARYRDLYPALAPSFHVAQPAT